MLASILILKGWLMTNLAESLAEEFIADVGEQIEKHGGSGRLVFALTLTELDEVEAGPEALENIRYRLNEKYPTAEIQLKGYPASGYNITAEFKIPAH
jgi:hypothetical protein